VWISAIFAVRSYQKSWHITVMFRRHLCNTSPRHGKIYILIVQKITKCLCVCVCVKPYLQVSSPGVFLILCVIPQSDWKVMQPIPNTFYLAKNKLHQNQKRKNNVNIKSWKCAPHSVMHTFTLFINVWCNLAKSFCVTDMIHKMRYCQFIWHQRNRKCIPHLNLANAVRTRCQV
jgi:hypothetical protein